VLGRRPSLEGRGHGVRACILRGSLRSHLRMRIRGKRAPFPRRDFLKSRRELKILISVFPPSGVLFASLRSVGRVSGAISGDLRAARLRSRVSLRSPGLQNRKEAERRQTRSQKLHLPAQRAPCGGALACRRPTAALARETVGPQGSASGHASEDQSGAFDPIRPPQSGGGDLARLHGRYPCRKTKRKNCPRPVSTSHAGHSAGRMMPEPPENGW
jgi:hypothetical protein